VLRVFEEAKVELVVVDRDVNVPEISLIEKAKTK
jgi:hypothetical protein